MRDVQNADPMHPIVPTTKPPIASIRSNRKSDVGISMADIVSSNETPVAQRPFRMIGLFDSFTSTGLPIISIVFIHEQAYAFIRRLIPPTKKTQATR